MILSVGRNSPRGERPRAFEKQLGAAWHQYSVWTDSWLHIEHCNGPKAVEGAYRTLLEGKVDPRVGYVCSMS